MTEDRPSFLVKEVYSDQAIIRLELTLDKEVVEWIDRLKSKLEIRSRSSIVNQILLEVMNPEGDALTRHSPPGGL